MRKLKNVFFVISAILFFIPIIFSQVRAQGTGRDPRDPNQAAQAATGHTPPKAIETHIKSIESTFDSGVTNTNSYGHTVNNALFSDLYCNLVPCGQTYNQIVGNSSALESLGSSMAMLYKEPVSTQEYIADLMRDSGLNIVQPVYAQGLGFSALSPVLNTWKVFRNIAYFFYVILFLVIGFMILFRQKIGSQTAVNVQQALPNIIISLLAVTFSYAIAGLLIDVMYLLMFFIVSVFQNYFTVNLQDYGLNSNIFQLGGELLFNNVGTANDAIASLIDSSLVGSNLGVLQGLGATVGGLTFAVVFAIALVFQIFRLFFELLKTYISIIISVVLSPIALMLGALPGNNAFSAWIKALVANLVAFPAVLIIIVLSLMLTNNGLKAEYANTLAGNGSGGFLPPYLIGSGTAGAVQSLLGLGIILILPDVVLQVKKSLGGSGGVFEQFANNFTSALDKGWKGGELVPGVGFTNTNLAGISGQNIMSKLVTGTKESNERVKNKKFNILGRGLIGEGNYKLNALYGNADIKQNAETGQLPKSPSSRRFLGLRRPTGTPPTTQQPPTSGEDEHGQIINKSGTVDPDA